MSIEEPQTGAGRSRLSAAGKRGSSAGRSSAFGRLTVSVRRGATQGLPWPGNPRVSTRRSPTRSSIIGRRSARSR